MNRADLKLHALRQARIFQKRDQYLLVFGVSEVYFVPDVSRPRRVRAHESKQLRTVDDGLSDHLRPLVSRFDPLVVPNSVPALVQFFYHAERRSHVLVRIAHEEEGQAA